MSEPANCSPFAQFVPAVRHAVQRIKRSARFIDEKVGARPIPASIRPSWIVRLNRIEGAVRAEVPMVPVALFPKRAAPKSQFLCAEIPSAASVSCDTLSGTRP